MAGYWSYSHPDSQYSELRDIQIFTPDSPYVRGLAQTTNNALQILAEVVVVALFVSNFIAQKLTNEWAAILPKAASDAEDVILMSSTFNLRSLRSATRWPVSMIV